MNNSLNSMGLINRGQLANDAQATLVGQAMTAAHQATSNNKDPRAAYNKVMNTPEAIATIDKSVDDIRRAYSNTVSARGGGTEKQESLTFAQAAEVARANAEVFKSEVNDLANPVNGSARITTTDGVPINTKVVNGVRVQDPTKSRAFTKDGQRAVNAAEAKQKIAENHAKILASRAADKQKGIDRAANAQAMADARASQIADRDDGGSYEDSGSGQDEGGAADSGSGGGQVGSENEAGDGFDGNKGGLVSQMKRSGLASKK